MGRKATDLNPSATGHGRRATGRTWHLRTTPTHGVHTYGDNTMFAYDQHKKVSWQWLHPSLWVMWLLLFAVSGNLLAANVNLAWNPSTASNVSGYIVYYGQSSGNYTASVDVGNITSYTLTGLQDGTAYYFAVSSYDITREFESRYSNETAINASAAPPTANFTASQASGTAPLAVTFTPTTTGAITSWQWSFGDGNTNSGTTNTVPVAIDSYVNPGTYAVSLTVTGPGGTATQTLSTPITVTPPPPTVSFTASQASGTAPLAVTFTPTTTGAITSWQWSFGDGNTNSGTTSTVPIAIDSYGNPGTYTVSLTVTGPGGTATQTLSTPITVTPPTPKPTVGFTASQTKGTAPLAVTFTPAVTGTVTSWKWSFGDGTTQSGTTSTVPDETEVYGSAGSYTVSLTVTGPGGSVTQTLSNPITVTSSTTGGTTGGTTGNITGLVAAYGFNEANGSYVEDASGTGNYGVITGAVRVSGGIFGNALKFSGTSSSPNWVTVQNSKSLALSTGMTLEAWVYPTAWMSGGSTVVMKQLPNTGSYDEAYLLAANNSTNQPMSAVWTGSQVTVGGNTQIPPNQWTHLATTYDGQYQSLYVNGVLVDLTPQTGPITTSTGVLQIGGNALWGGYFQGYIDEVRIYNRALTNAQIISDSTTAISVSNPLKFVAGDQNVESKVESIPAGVARMFKITPQTTQTLTNIQVYLDASSTAKTLIAAIYTTANGQPYALWGSTSVLAAQAGAWNSASMWPLSLSAGQSYWIAILGTGGTVNLRGQTGTGTSVTETSASSTLMTSLPNAWTAGSVSTGGPTSVYGAGY